MVCFVIKVEFSVDVDGSDAASVSVSLSVSAGQVKWPASCGGCSN